MCGIVGISLKNERVDESILQKATFLLNHRGPDSFGTALSKNSQTGLGHTRLSFIDLGKSGAQPMKNIDGTILTVLNGEIYNYIELRDELIGLGHKFETGSDTEILIHGWKQWNKKLPEKLDGMFSFAILDENSQELFLARDRFGIKPLYYHHDPDQFVFASEIKSILAFDSKLKKIRPESVSLFLANRYVPTPHTIWENIFKLEPGHSLTLDLDSFELSKNTYWKLEICSSTPSKNEAYDRFRNILITSVEKHLRSDVPIGSFLSGGFDSSALVYIMQKELGYPTSAFSIGFENWDQSEDVYAEMVARSLDVLLYTSKPKELHLNSVEKLMWHYDDPIADISIIPTFEVSGLAVKHVKAVVSGEGADEILGGYWWHKPDSFPKRNFFKNLFGKNHNFGDIKNHYINAMSMGLYDSDELKMALTGKFAESIPKDPFQHFDSYEIKGVSQLKQLQYLDLKTFMPELILTKVDRASMAHSLEVRVPFLQHQLVELLFHLDENIYFKNGEQKPFLKKLLYGKVPDQILQRKKQGFVGPDRYYMDMSVYRSSLLKGRLINDGVVNENYVDQKLKEKDHWRLWKLFVLENWWRNWMNG
jgi:asparagine synthase (glutamine-hydrolysing)